MTYLLRHISIRVPWRHTGCDGRVCAAPPLNGSCLKLKRIAEDRDDAAEEAVAGKRLDELPQSKWPACAAERMGFMAPFEYVRMADHPYNCGLETSHGRFKRRRPVTHLLGGCAAVRVGAPRGHGNARRGTCPGRAG